MPSHFRGHGTLGGESTPCAGRRLVLAAMTRQRVLRHAMCPDRSQSMWFSHWVAQRLTPHRQPQSGTGHMPCLANHCRAWWACSPWPQLAQKVTNRLSATSISFAFWAAAAIFDSSPNLALLDMADALLLRGATVTSSGMPSHCRQTAQRGRCLPHRGQIVPLASASMAACCAPAGLGADVPDVEGESNFITAFWPWSSAGFARLPLQ